MSRKIELLDPLTINQIAAGEVIEDAACAVKELVENAIDAGASFISVETRGSGRLKIAVRDDGSGMDEEDLLACTQRYATSKITSLLDLFTLSTLGFRGEALASIASISKMKIESAKSEGHLLYLEGGEQKKLQSCARKRGTTIEVLELFYNVPVRREFQKREAKERKRIETVLIEAALAYRHVGLEWIDEGKRIFFLPSHDDFLSRIDTLLGAECARELIPLKKSDGEIEIEGFVGKATFHRPHRGGYYLFLNRRPITSPLVFGAIEEAFGERLSPHRFPFFTLHLTLPPSFIDVNVHPRKKEVRLRCEERIASFIIDGVRATLEEEAAPPVLTKPFVSEVNYFTLNDLSQVPEVQYVETPPLFPAPRFSFISSLERYWLFTKEGDEAIWLVDQKRCEERLFFERMAVDREKMVQPLLFPLTFECSRQEALFFEEMLPMLQRLCIMMRPFGPSSFLIEALPDSLSEREVLSFLDTLQQERAKKEERALFLLVSCKVRREMSHEGAIRCIEALLALKEPHLTMQGEPIVRRLALKDLAKILG